MVNYKSNPEYEPLMRNLSIRLQDARRAHRYTQADLATELHVTKDFISKVENGKTPVNPFILKEYCRLFELSADTALGLDEASSVPMDKELSKYYNKLSRRGKKLALSIIKLMAEQTTK